MTYYDYDTVNKAFEQAVNHLQDNLQYLANESKVSDRFITMQNSIIKAIIQYQHQTEQIISHLEWENIRLTKERIKKIEDLKDVQLMLESICIIHGILDFQLWMTKGKDCLFLQAVNDYHQRTITIPYSLREKYYKLHKEAHDVKT